MNNLTYIKDTTSLKVGDKVGILKYPTVGWKDYKHPIVEECTIDRITPKRTKFVVGGKELSEFEVRQRCVVIDEVALEENRIARKFLKCYTKKNKIERAKDNYGHLLCSLHTLDEEDLDRVLNLLTHLENKYLVGDNNEDS